jgi:hypothetical protein
MSVLKCKKLMLSFRVSEEQFLILQRLSSSHGARCMSDYVRDTLFGLPQTQAPMPAERLEQRIELLATSLDALSKDVERLHQLVGSAPAAE